MDRFNSTGPRNGQHHNITASLIHYLYACEPHGWMHAIDCPNAMLGVRCRASWAGKGWQGIRGWRTEASTHLELSLL